jgi:hypothetical protein
MQCDQQWKIAPGCRKSGVLFGEEVESVVLVTILTVV